MNRLQVLHDAGTSIWLDTLSRDLYDDQLHSLVSIGISDTRST